MHARFAKHDPELDSFERENQQLRDDIRHLHAALKTLGKDVSNTQSEYFGAVPLQPRHRKQLSQPSVAPSADNKENSGRLSAFLEQSYQSRKGEVSVTGTPSKEAGYRAEVAYLRSEPFCANQGDRQENLRLKATLAARDAATAQKKPKAGTRGKSNNRSRKRSTSPYRPATSPPPVPQIAKRKAAVHKRTESLVAKKKPVRQRSLSSASCCDARSSSSKVPVTAEGKRKRPLAHGKSLCQYSSEVQKELSEGFSRYQKRKKQAARPDRSPCPMCVRCLFKGLPTKSCRRCCTKVAH